MWVFFTSRLRQWLILAVAVPLATVLVRTIRRRIEKKTGETRLTRGLGHVEDLGRKARRKERKQLERTGALTAVGPGPLVRGRARLMPLRPHRRHPATDRDGVEAVHPHLVRPARARSRGRPG